MSDILTPSPMGEEPHEPHEAQVKEVNPFGNGRAGKWFDNFWYHYKFQTIAAAFLIVVIIFCTIQCATKPKDPIFNFCYAGTLNLGASMSGEISTQEAVRRTLTPAASVIMDEDDPEQVQARISIYGYTIIDDSPYSAVQEQSRLNRENLRSELDAAHAYFFLLSEELYRTYAFSPESNTPYMMPVEDYLPAAGVGTLRLSEDGYGVYLASTCLASLPGFDTFPPDTVLCLRSSFTLFNRGQEDIYRQNEALFRAILAGDIQS